jgi:hypothetical protein
MKRLLTSLFATRKSARRPRPDSLASRPRLEALEDRLCPSTTTSATAC